jgi:O-antigen chain-terminating methyltransferase
MRGMRPGTVGAISVIHVVEHLEFADLVALIDESLRALAPGGVLIMETPNPENVTVGSCNFWYDPTHRVPLPPELLRWTTEARGFARSEVRRLHPVPPDKHLRDGAPGVVKMLNEKFYGPQDYAVVAHKSA